MRLAGAAVRHSRHGKSRGTRKAGTLGEGCGLARRGLSLECRCLQRSNPAEALPFPANRRTVASCLLASLVPCSRHNRLSAAVAPPSPEPGVRQWRLHRFPQRGAGTLPSTLRSSGHRRPIARLGTHSPAEELQTVWQLAPHPLTASNLTSS